MATATRLVAFAVACMAFAGVTHRPHPNVLLIVVDTLRADHLGSYGYTRATSPNLDALARRGTRFAAARSTTSWTGASVASILTGLYPIVHGVDRGGVALSELAMTMPEGFHDAGYATAAFSANPAFVTPEMGFAQGFDQFDVLHGPLAMPGTPDVVPGDPHLKSLVKVATADQVTDAGLAWLRENGGKGRPEFLYLHYMDPHAGYRPPAAYAARFGVSLDAPLAGHRQNEILITFKAPPAEDLATLVALYDGEIAFTDAEIGRLIAGAAAASRRPLLIVMAADHGEEFGDHGGLMHGVTLWDEQLRVPWIVAGPGVPRGLVVQNVVSLVSLRATVTDLAGLPPAGSGAAPSLAQVMRRGATAPNATVFADLGLPHPDSPLELHQYAAIDGSWKLFMRRSGVLELFDLAADPGEHVDVRSAEPARERILEARLRERERQAVVARLPSRSIELTEELRARLKALGYAQ